MADTSLLLQKSYTLIQQAIVNDRNGNYQEALRLYLNGLEGFISALKLEKNDRIKQTLRLKMDEYMNRAEQLKGYVQQHPQQQQQQCCTPIHSHSQNTTKSTITPSAPPQYHPTPTNTEDLILPSVPSFNPLPTIATPPPFNPSATSNNNTNNLSFISSKKILNGSIGNSYEALFGEYIKESTWIKIEDPYIRKRHQIDNFIKFVEVVISKCIYKDGLKSCQIPTKPSSKFKIDLITSTESKQQEEELKLTFFQIKDTLAVQYNIAFNYQFSNTIHDRSIECSNGHYIKLGRGLDIFQKPLNSNNALFSPVSTFNQNLSLSLECNIDVFLKK